jgi:hypothetical protein
LQTFANSGNNTRRGILEKGLGGHTVRAMHMSMPILPVPSGLDVPPFVEEEPEHHDNDDEEHEELDPRILVANRIAAREAWNADVAHHDKLGLIVRKVNGIRYATLQLLMRTIVVYSLDDESRALICNGHNDNTNAIKVILKVMRAAFHDHDTVLYRNDKIKEIMDFENFQEEQGWSETECQIYRDVRRNPHMVSHKDKDKPGLLETMRIRNDGRSTRKKVKGQVDRGPPKSPTRTRILNMHKTPRMGNHAPGQGGFNANQSIASLSKSQVSGAVPEKIKSPLSIIVAENACWALCVLTVVTCVGNRLELLECGQESLRDMGHTVHGLPSEEEEEEAELAALNMLGSGGSKAGSAAATPKSSNAASRQGSSHASPVPFNLGEEDENAGLALGTITEHKVLGSISVSSIATSDMVLVPPLATTAVMPDEPSILAYPTLNKLENHQIPFYARLHKLILHVNSVHTAAQEAHLEVEATHILPHDLTANDKAAPPQSDVFLT